MRKVIIQQNFDLKLPGINFDVPGHGIVYGRTGTGKSVCLELLALSFWKAGWKVVDIWNSLGRLEGAWFSLPPDKWRNYWNKLLNGGTVRNAGKEIKATGFCDELLEGLKDGFPTKVMLPNSEGIPENVPDNWNLYSIPFSDLDSSDFSLLFGDVLYGPKQVLTKDALSKLNSDSTLLTFKLIVDRILSKGYTNVLGLPWKLADRRTQASMDRMLLSLFRSQMVTSEGNPMALNLKAELEDTQNISVFLQNYIDDDNLRYFNVHWLYRRIVELMDKRQVKNRKVLIICRELSEIAPHNSPSPYQQQVTSLLGHIVSRARGAGVTCFFDTQSPLNVNRLIASQCKNKIVFSLNHPDELQNIMMGASAFLNDGDWNYIMKQGTGWCCIISDNIYRGKIYPPPHRHHEPGESLFQHWKREGRAFKSLKEDREIIEKELREAIELYKTEKGHDKLIEKVAPRKKKGEKYKDFVRGIESSFIEKDIRDKLEVSYSLSFNTLKEMLGDNEIEIIEEGKGVNPTLYRVKKDSKI